MSTNALSAPSNAVTLPADMIAQRLCLFHLGFTQWTGQSVLRRSDYTASDEDIPEAKVAATYGMKRLINPEHLRVFEKLAKRAQVALAQAGIPFFRGYVVPLEMQASLSKTLRAICDEFDDARDAFIADYDRLTAEWQAANPKLAASMKLSTPSASDVAGRIQSGFATFRFSPIDGETEGFEKGIKGLFDEILTDCSRRADRMRSLLTGKTAQMVTRKTVGDLKPLAEKLRSLTFLNPGVAPVLDVIDRLIATLPSKGHLSEAQFKVLDCTLSLLQDPGVLKKIANGTLLIDELMKSYGYVLSASTPQALFSGDFPAMTAETDNASLSVCETVGASSPSEEEEVSSESSDYSESSESSESSDSSAPEGLGTSVAETASAASVAEKEEDKEEDEPDEAQASEGLSDDLDARLAAFFENAPEPIAKPSVTSVPEPTMVLSAF